MFLKRHLIILGISTLIILSSCSGYEKLLKSKDYNLKYNAALEFYNNKKYSKAVGLFEQLIPVYRGTERSVDVNYYQAKCYYKQKDYYMAGYYFNNFSKSFPKDSRVEEGDFMVAYCFYLTSPRPQLDQDITQKSLAAFYTFLAKYPKTKRKKDIQNYIDELQHKLIEKSFNNSKLYYDLGRYKSAIVALKNSLLDHPNTPFREEIMFLLVKSNYQLAYDSVEEKKKKRFQNTVDEYFSFISEFPESKYSKDVKKMYEVANKYLQ